MSVRIRWVLCKCGKQHAAHGISPATTCSCGLPLWGRMWSHGTEYVAVPVAAGSSGEPQITEEGNR